MEVKPLAKTLLIIGFLFTVGNMVYVTMRYVTSVVEVQEKVTLLGPLYLIGAAAVPFVWWLFSTMSDFWNYYNRKFATLYLVSVNFVAVLMMPLWTLLFNIFAYKICSIPTGRNMTPDMVLNLCRIVIGGITFLIGLAFFHGIKKIIEQDSVHEKIEGFRIQDVLDMRENKENQFDLHIVNDLNTGRDVPIKEGDRFVHMFVLGAPGTGKTSSTGTPSVICDLNKKLLNARKRQKALLTMIEGGRARVRLPYANEKRFIDEANSKEGYKNDIEAESLVIPEEGCEEEFKDILKTYPDCGMTVMAPNNSLNTDIIKLAKARNLMVNVIDPAFTYKDDNVRMLGINPFYVELGLSPDERLTQINNKAQTFAEILMAVNEINGVGDVYFRDINTSVTTNVAIACMLDANINGRQTNIVEIQQCIGEFRLLQSIVDDIQAYLHMKVEVISVKDKNNSPRGRSTISREEEEQAKEIEKTPSEVQTYRFTPCVSEDEIEEPYYSEGMTLEEYNEMLQKESSNYYETIHFILQELLGDGYEKMFDQARGLRNLINKLVLDPRVKKVLSASDKDFIDWDRALSHNEITVINTALEFGPQSSTALGLFVMLNLKIAVLRRPIDRRSDHFILIDEASQYMHPMYEDMFAIFRQYRVAVTLMMQSLSQMEKTPLTQYLRGVIMTAGTHIVFGRINADEMKYYEAMAGIIHSDDVQKTVMANSEFDSNHAISHSERTTKKDIATVAGADIRQRHFQECTVFKIDGGTVKSGFVAKVSFPKKVEYKDKGATFIDWSRFYPKNWIEAYATEGSKPNKNAAESQEIIKSHDSGISTTKTKNVNDRDFSTIPSMEDEPEEDYRAQRPEVYERSETEQREREKDRASSLEKPEKNPMLSSMSLNDLLAQYAAPEGNTEPEYIEGDNMPSDDEEGREIPYGGFNEGEDSGEEDNDLPFGRAEESGYGGEPDGEDDTDEDEEEDEDAELEKRRKYLEKQNKMKGKTRF